MNIDLIINFKVVLTLHVVVALKLNQPSHFLLPSNNFSNICSTLLNSTNEVLSSIKTLYFDQLLGDQNYTEGENSYVISATIKYLVDSERLNGPLLHICFCSYI